MEPLRWSHAGNGCWNESESVLLIVTCTSALVLASGGIELVANGCNEPATVIVVALPQLDLMVIDQISVATAVKQVLASQFNAQTVTEECLDKTDTEDGLMIVQIDVLIMSWALVSEIQLPCQSLAEPESIVRLAYQHWLVQGNVSFRCFHSEPLLAETH